MESYGEYNSPMLSFPSTFNSGGDGFTLIGAPPEQNQEFRSVIQNSDYNGFKSIITDRIKSTNIETHQLRNIHMSESNMNISQYNKYLQTIQLGDPNNKITNDAKVYFEDPYHFPSSILREINNYKFMYKAPTREIVGMAKGKNDTSQVYVGNTVSAPSLFNPKYNVQVIGLTHNVPLLNDTKNRGVYSINNDYTDCSVRKLVELSNRGLLGQETFRLVDFIYCKDFGKVSNNHLITLRKFSHPIGDTIGKPANIQFRTSEDNTRTFMNMGELAHMVTWFGTDDNKLEDIIKYSYQYTWKPLSAKRQDMDSKEADPDRGMIGLLSNMNPNYNRMVNDGTAAGGGSLLGLLLGSRTSSFNKANSDSLESMRMYDGNKVYSPLQTIQDTHIPEGKLVFSNEFNLNFSYKLRAYDNINPKSAFLDLLGNIHETTYYRGTFWGGAQVIIGPGPNNAQYRKVYNVLDQNWDKAGDFFKKLTTGQVDVQAITGIISSFADTFLGFFGTSVNGLAQGVKTAAENVTNAVTGASSAGEAVKEGAKAAGQEILKGIKTLNDRTGASDLLKGQVKNMMGRPSFYAFDSLLSNKLVGLWHVTIGNPRNPILSMGNLILTNTSIQQSGPLGLDDFPTEIKVTCTLKHAMSRDITTIQKMYTQGLSALYMSTSRNLSKEMFAGFNNEDYEQVDKALATKTTSTTDKESGKVTTESKPDMEVRRAANQNYDDNQIDTSRKQFTSMTSEYDDSNNFANLGLVQNDHQFRFAMYNEDSLQRLHIAMDEVGPTIG